MPPLYKIKLDKDYESNFQTEGILIKSNSQYLVEMAYRYPKDRVKGSDAKIKISGPSIEEYELRVGSESDKIQLPLNVSPMDFTVGRLKFTSESIPYSLDAGKQGQRIYVADMPISVTAILPFLIILISIFILSYAQEATANSKIFSSDILIAAVLDFLKFSVIVYAVYRFRGSLKITGL